MADDAVSPPVPDRRRRDAIGNNLLQLKRFTCIAVTRQQGYLCLFPTSCEDCPSFFAAAACDFRHGQGPLPRRQDIPRQRGDRRTGHTHAAGSAGIVLADACDPLKNMTEETPVNRMPTETAPPLPENAPPDGAHPSCTQGG